MPAKVALYRGSDALAVEDDVAAFVVPRHPVRRKRRTEEETAAVAGTPVEDPGIPVMKADCEHEEETAAVAGQIMQRTCAAGASSPRC